MTTPDSELRRLVRMPLQAFGQEAPSDPPAEAFVPVHVVLKAKRIPAARLRIFFSPAHDIAHLLHAALGLAPAKDGRSWAEPSDWRGRELRRMLRTWTPQSHVDVAVHPANLEFLRPDEEIVVSGWAPAVKRDHTLSLAMLAAPLSTDVASEVMSGLVTHLALAELRGAARCLHQKRLSRNALPASGASTGPQPAAPARKLLAAARRPFRGPNRQPTLQRLLPVRRHLRFAAA